MSETRYPSLNGLRAISILLVILYHLNLVDNAFSSLKQFNWLLPFTSFLFDGQLGVNVFFVISGFLITSLLLQEEQRTFTISLKKFFIRRTIRIFPAFYFLLLVYLVLQVCGYIYINKSSWLTAFTYTKYFNWQLEWFTAHAWSLSIEEHFYILWPLVFLLGPKIRKNVTIAFIIMVPIVRIYLFLYPVSWMNELTIFTRIDAIATGCLFALYKDEIIEKISQYWNRVFYLSALCLFFLRSFPIVASKVHLGFLFIPLGRTHGTIANFTIGLIMMYSVFGPKGLWFKFLNLKVLNYIGILSYSIYLWQQLFISKLDYWPVKFPQNLVFLGIMSVFSYNIIEKPFLKLKYRFSQAQSKAEIATSDEISYVDNLTQENKLA